MSKKEEDVSLQPVNNSKKEKTIEEKNIHTNKTEKTETIEQIEGLVPPEINEKEAQHIMSQIMDICAIYQSTPNLPEISRIDKSTIFYLEEILKVLIYYRILVP